MKKISYLQLLTLVLVFFCGFFLLFSAVITLGKTPPLLSLWLSLLFLGLSVVILLLGLMVRRYQKRTAFLVPIDPINAFRIVIFSRALVFFSVFFLGFSGSLVVVCLLHWYSYYLRVCGYQATFNFICALVLLVFSCLTERWCIDRGDDEENRSPLPP